MKISSNTCCSLTSRQTHLHRHWNSHRDIKARNYDIHPGSYYYIKRFESSDKVQKWRQKQQQEQKNPA